MQTQEFEFLKWLGHSSFMFEDKGHIVYIDPFKLKGFERKADIIFITHPHFDHMSMEDIKKISKDTTKFVVPKDCADKFDKNRTIAVTPNEDYEVDGIKFSTLPAYNTARERLSNHPKQNAWVGYVIHVKDKHIYHAGDTDPIPEMERIDVDLALIPMGGTYTMSVEEAISISKKMKAKHIAPIHYRMLLGKEGSDAAEKKLLSEIKQAMILEEEDVPLYNF